MTRLAYFKSALIGGASLAVLTTGAYAAEFNIPSGDLKTALDVYTTQTGVELVVAGEAVRGVRTKGAKGELTAYAALSRILAGTGFVMQRDESGAVGIVRAVTNVRASEREVDVAQAAPKAAAAGIESVVVTSSKIKGDIQTVPIAITALSQEQLTSRQIAGGPDLVKEVPNLTFSKTNFTGYNIQIRGIGTQAISVTTDPAVAVAFNDIPFIRNHFFEQEFYDVNQVEVLRGPQGTLYGRNATAGVVNVISAKPADQFEAMASADIGNYHNRRYEGMVNIPIVDDRLDLRVAGEWTKRDGYSFNEITNAPIDGRDLWSGRVTLGWKPASNVQATFVWEHFSEDDDRMRTAKQLCKTAPIPASVDGVPVGNIGEAHSDASFAGADNLSQGCLPASLYSPESFEVPNGYSLSYYTGLVLAGNSPVRPGFDVYSETVQSRNLRDIQSSINPIYKAKNDTLELNADYQISPDLTFTSQTGYNQDFLWSTEDYDRFDSAPGAFSTGNSLGDGAYTQYGLVTPDPLAGQNGVPADAGVFCDPQLGCSDRLVAQDLSDEHAWQLSQEFRLVSNFSGPLNFSIGGNYLHYETQENYYVFINTLTMFAATSFGALNAQHPWDAGVSDGSYCLAGGLRDPNPAILGRVFSDCEYIDPHPLGSLDNEGHNYFLSQNPYVLNSYAGFGEAYYTVTPELKLTGGLRWTDDQKHFLDIPSELVIPGYGYAVTAIVNQQWNQLTGRLAANWTPKLDFTDQTLVYGSFARGYKAGGANPPGATFSNYDSTFLNFDPIHPLTFKPEFVDAYELGSKNTLLDGALTLNGDVFFYNYKAYQISEIEDRSAINLNFDATVKGAELETSWEPAPGLKFSFAGGYENATLNKGDHAVDLMDRTAGHPGWMVVKPFLTGASNCILPDYVVAATLAVLTNGLGHLAQTVYACDNAYSGHVDPLTSLPYKLNPTAGVFGNPVSSYLPIPYSGFDPLAGTPGDPYTGQNYDSYLGIDAGPAPNNGQGFDKNLSGNQLPSAPHFTTSLSAEYPMPVSEDWAATLHSDFYWQSQSYARVFNDRPYDKIRGYSNINLALILTSASGWQVLGYLKNVFNTTAITGDFLNSDDTGLTTNVFLTDPRLFGVRVTKNW
ncbi:MAG TPA: TonB-dependent receptor [Rhizomicrobium sp.]|nr:TonB-dependent receptor [Rhizomicrobium sp.]